MFAFSPFFFRFFFRFFFVKGLELSSLVHAFSIRNKNLSKYSTDEYYLLENFGLIRPSLSQAAAVWVPIFVYFWPFWAIIWQFHVLFISLPVTIVAFGVMGSVGQQ